MDLNKLAKSIVDKITKEEKKEPEKNPAAVALGRLGGLKGGKKRAENLSDERKSEIARQAAKARWDKHEEDKKNG